MAVAGTNTGPITSSATFGPFSPTPVVAPAPPPIRPALPATLSADGVHFTAGHALLIGVGSYAGAGLSAPGTAADAAALEHLLTDPQCAGFPPAQVRRLSAQQATCAGILAALDAFAAQLPNDASATALIFFAGHGIQRPEGFALLGYDYTGGAIPAGAITAAAFHASVAAIRARARRVLVLLNCCHSGGAGAAVLGEAEDGATLGAAPPRAFYAPLAVGGGQVVVSSSRPQQLSGARSSADPQHTTFGAQLIAGLRGQAPGAAAGISVFELFAFLSAAVPKDAATISYKGAPLVQEPLLFAAEVDTDFAVALRPGGAQAVLSAVDDAVAALAWVEIQLAGYAREADAPLQLLQERAALLRQLEQSR